MTFDTNGRELNIISLFYCSSQTLHSINPVIKFKEFILGEPLFSYRPIIQRDLRNQVLDYYFNQTNQQKLLYVALDRRVNWIKSSLVKTIPEITNFDFIGLPPINMPNFFVPQTISYLRQLREKSSLNDPFFGDVFKPSNPTYSSILS